MSAADFSGFDGFGPAEEERPDLSSAALLAVSKRYHATGKRALGELQLALQAGQHERARRLHNAVLAASIVTAVYHCAAALVEALDEGPERTDP